MALGKVIVVFKYSIVSKEFWHKSVETGYTNDMKIVLSCVLSEKQQS